MVQRVNAKLKILLFGYENTVHEASYQGGILLLIIGLSIALSVTFSAINYQYDRHWLSYIELAVGLVLTPYFFMGLKGRWLPRSREFSMAMACIIFTALFVDGGIGNTGIYWVLVFPFLAFLLMGVGSGWLWIASYTLLLVGILFLHGQGLLVLSYSQDTMYYVPTMYLFFTVIAFSSQLLQERRQSELNRVNRELTESEKNLRDVQQHLEKTILRRTNQLQRINKKLRLEVDKKIEALQQKDVAEKKYEQAQKMESLGTLVGGIAHDFNNMLSGITANLYLIQHQVDSPEVQKRLSEIGELTLHAADMIRQLMTFARKDEVRLIDFDLRPFFNEAYKLARVSIPEHIRCELELSKDELFIKGDGTQIQQILMNLMNNACDALDGVSDPFIKVSLNTRPRDEAFVINHPDVRDCDYLILSVQDNGCGMSEEKLHRIYEPFYTTKAVGKGTGLGLSMVYGAVQTHGGLIDVVSYPGTGTRFNIYLPIVDSVRTRTKSQDNVIEEGRGETILLVDDDHFLLEVSEQLLINLGYKILTASNGLQAIAVYKANMGMIDLVLMDVVMPVLGGKAAADRIQLLNPDAKVIFTTGYDRDHDATVEMLSDWNMVLNKPLAVDELSRIIRQQLN